MNLVDLFEDSIAEQYSGPPKAIGTAFIGLILKHQKDSMPVLIDFEDGQQAFRLGTTEVKDWFVRIFDSYSKRGKRDQFLETMGTRIGFQKLVSRYIMDKAKAERERLGIGSQKKRADEDFLGEDAKEDNARTQRMLQQLRLANPLAKTDSEALAYAFIKQQEKDQKEIDRLEQEIDDTEKSVQQDLKSTLSRLRGRGAKAQEKLGGMSAADERQDALLKKISALDKEQSRAIDDLEKEVDSLSKTEPKDSDTAAPAPSIVVAPQTAPAAKKSAAPRKPRTKKIAAVEPTASDYNVTDLKAAIDKRDAERAAKAQQTLPLPEPTAAQDVEMTTGTIPNADVAQQLAKDTASKIVDFNKVKSAQANVKPLQKAVGLEEGLRPGEYHEAEVTFDDGSKQTVKITSDEGFRSQITQHFAKQGKKVTDINVDWSIKSVNEAEKKPKPTNPQLWGRAKAAAKSKFDVYPSAYANAWAAKWYKQHGGGWR